MDNSALDKPTGDERDGPAQTITTHCADEARDWGALYRERIGGGSLLPLELRLDLGGGVLLQLVRG